MKKINWDIFFDNSSTTDALISFVIGEYTFKQFSEECWPKECKVAIVILKNRGYIKALRSAKRVLNKRMYYW